MAADKEPDDIFVDVALEKGLVTPAQVEDLRQASATLKKIGMSRAFVQIARERKVLSEEQVAEVRREMARRGVLPRLGPYELITKLGEGGMGDVYKARQTALDRFVALKVLPAELARDADYVARFEREAKLAAKVSHPNLVQVHDVGSEGGRHYLAMELVSGGDGAKLLASGPLEERRALEIALGVARALEAAHGQGIIHRDIKPSNIMLTEDGVPKLADLGVARDISGGGGTLTRTGTAVGTPAYMSPEQCRGERNVDGRSDIYSLGATLFHLACGHAPFAADTALVLMAKQLNDPTPDVREANARVSEATAGLIHRMMEKDRERRPKDASALAAEIQGILEGQEAKARPGVAEEAPPPSPAKQAAEPSIAPAAVAPEAPPKGEGRRRKALVAAAVACAVLVIAGGLVLLSRGRGPESAGPAVPTAQRPAPSQRPPPEPASKSAVPEREPAAPKKEPPKETGPQPPKPEEPEKPVAVEPRAQAPAAPKAEAPTVPTGPPRAPGSGVSEVESKLEKTGRFMFPGVPLAEAVAQIARHAGVEVTYNPAAEGAQTRKVSTATGETTAGEALEKVLHPNGLDYDVTAEGLRIVPRTAEELARKRQPRPRPASPPEGSKAAAKEAPGEGTAVPEAKKEPAEAAKVLIARLHKALKARNPDYTGKGQFVVRDGRIVEADLTKCNIRDLSPLKGLPLEKLNCNENQITDISALKGMKLRELAIDGNRINSLAPLKGMPIQVLEMVSIGVADLSALKGMKLTYLDCAQNRIRDLSPLHGMPLEKLLCAQNSLTDLSPLKGLPLRHLNAYKNPIADLTPLKGMPLEFLHLEDTLVGDLSPLSGMSLTFLSLTRTKVRDLSPLRGMPLQQLDVGEVPVRDLSPLLECGSFQALTCSPELTGRGVDVLRRHKALQTINGKPVEEFWRQWDKEQGKKGSKDK